MNPETFVQVSSLLAGLAAALLQQYLHLLSKKKKRKGKKTTLQGQVADLTSSLKNSVGLLDSIQTEINRRHQLSEKLKADAEKYDRLAQLKKEQVEAVVSEIRGTLETENRKSFWKGVGVNLFFFVLGYAISFLARL